MCTPPDVFSGSHPNRKPAHQCDRPKRFAECHKNLTGRINPKRPTYPFSRSPDCYSAPFGRGFSLRFDNGASEQGPILPRWHYIMTKEIGTEAALENCRALINQIDAGLSAEEPFINVSSAAELLFYLEFAASALQRDATNSGPHPR